ncbi:MAG TPA: proline racemase family protein [Motilibacteraceae bacterium]|nr:proline racemase family protein [Motilibacteraceae bacterium]
MTAWPAGQGPAPTAGRSDWLEVSTTDYHTAGEPFRIVRAGAPDVPGATVAERRQHAMRSPETELVRRLLGHEPRGHADMYGGLLVPPDDDGAHLGVLFWHKDGWSTACGHGTIALGAWAVESGLVAPDADGTADVVVDVPSGRVVAKVRCVDGQVDSVTFQNVPSYVLHRAVPVRTSRGVVGVDVVYGGAIYATLAADELGLAVEPAHHDELLAVGREIKHALDRHEVARHPEDDRLSGVYGTILVDDLGQLPEASGAGGRRLHQRNVTVFADGQIDRSPCGSGTAARVALLAADGLLGPDDELVHDSIVGTRFLARLAGTVPASVRASAGGHREGVVVEVTGTAHRTGEHTFVLDPRDDLGTGFVLR